MVCWGRRVGTSIEFEAAGLLDVREIASGDTPLPIAISLLVVLLRGSRGTRDSKGTRGSRGNADSGVSRVRRGSIVVWK